MRKINFLLLLALTGPPLTLSGLNASPCGSSPNWVAYKDEKCFTLINQLVTREEAKQICAQEATDGLQPIVTIGSPEEQEFLTKFIFQDGQIIENVWLGALRYNTTEFYWEDGTALEFTNWEEGSPSEVEAKNCTQMTSQLSRSNVVKNKDQAEDGLWSDVSCAKRNLVVCQKLQAWSNEDLQKLFLDMRKQLNDLQEENNILQNNPVPIGFVYVQLPAQSEPMVTWPNVQWQEITAAYAGLFFRAAGGGAAAFGSIQEENSPRITQVAHRGEPNHPPWVGLIDIPLGDWSPYITLATSGDAWREYLRFYSTGGEVRPRNQAVRIWKRII